MTRCRSRCHAVSLERVPKLFFFFNDTATTEIYTLSLHDALPISQPSDGPRPGRPGPGARRRPLPLAHAPARSEEHTSELQSHLNLVCRLLLEKKNASNHTQRHVPNHSPRTLPSTHTHLNRARRSY